MNPDTTKAYSIQNDPTALAAYQESTFTPTAVQATAAGQPITATSLAPTTPLNVPPTQTSTTAVGISAGADTSLTAHETALAKLEADNLAAAKLKADTNTNDLTSLMNQMSGIYQQPDVVATNEKVSASETLNNDAFNALQASKRSQEVQQKAILSNGNITKEQAQQKLDEVNRDFAFTQADLSIALDVSNRNYTAAQNTMNNLISLKLQPLQLKYDFLSKFISSNADNLSKAETNQLNDMRDTVKQEHDKMATDLKALSDAKFAAMKTASEQGAPPNIINAIQSAQTPDQVAIAAGHYGAPISKTASVQEYEYAKSQGYKGTFTQYQNEDANRKRAAGSVTNISLGSPEKQDLLGSGLTSSDITNIQNDINAHGIDAVLSSPGMTAAQKAAISKVYGVVPPTVLTRENVAKLYGITDNGASTGFLGLGQTTSQKLDGIMTTIQKYRSLGQTDDQILKILGVGK